MEKQNGPIRLYAVCWGILSIIGGSCLTAVSFWAGKVGEWVGLIPYICAGLMMCLLKIAAQEAHDAENWKPNRPTVKKIARTGRKAAESGKIR
jgi:hypothetical protein